MRLQDLVGKIVVRKQPVITRHSGSLLIAAPEYTKDTSYCTDPIRIEAIQDGVIYYVSGYSLKIQILNPLYNDEHWAEVPTQYQSQLWQEPAKPMQGVE